MADTRANNDHRFTIRIPKHIAADLRRVAKAEANTTCAVVRRLITRGLREHDDNDRERRG